MTGPLNRRLALLGAAASSVALAVPAAHAAHLNEDAGSKVVRLMRELSEALTGFNDGQFRAIVQPSTASMPILLRDQREAQQDDNLLRFLKNAEARDLSEYHTTRLGLALAGLHGGRWVGTRFEEGAFAKTPFVFFVKHPSEKTSYTTVFE